MNDHLKDALGPDGPGAVDAGPGAVAPDGTENAPRSVPSVATPPEPDGAGPTAERADADLAHAPADAELGGADGGDEPVDVEALVARAAKADEYLSLAQRTQADFENYRKRSAREVAVAKERGATRLALDLLPAVDNLERALAHAPVQAGGDPPAFVAGIEHVHADVIAALQRAGIERYSPEGEPFDPQLHEAVAQQPVDGFAPGTVVEVFQRGYRIGDTVVRPARVVVAG